METLDARVLESLICGECFRFKKQNGVYRGVINDTLYTLSSKNLDLLLRDKMLYDFFDMGRNYEEIKAYLSSLHPVMKTAIESAPYIRILKQDPKEVLLSFILTSCNNISRISLIIERLSKRFGEKVEKAVGEDMSEEVLSEYYTFPTIRAVASTTEEELRSLGLGFRAPFFLNAARSIASGEFDLEKCRILPVNEARSYLCTLSGIGAKVADCILLFGFNRLECFPKDVHIKRVMSEYFKGKDESFFHPYEGIAEQFLFYLDLSKKVVL